MLSGGGAEKWQKALYFKLGPCSWGAPHGTVGKQQLSAAQLVAYTQLAAAVASA